MQHYKDLNDMLEKSPNAYNYYSGLSYDVQQMLSEAKASICTENELIAYINNYTGTENR